MNRTGLISAAIAALASGGVGFLLFALIPSAPLAVAGCGAACLVFSLAREALAGRPRGGPSPEALEQSAEKEKTWTLLMQTLGGLRKNADAINGRVSQSLDAAIIAGWEIGGNIRSVEKKTDGLHERISSASSASEEITVNIRRCNEQMAKNEAAVSKTGAAVEQINTSVQAMAAIAAQKTADLEQLKETVEQGSRRAGLASQSIAEASGLADEISGIVQVINTIASQTNLLSMNAAIEAAHAGEAGKGFAVVAAEVRTLAESTSANAKSIADSIKNIVGKIESAAKASAAAGDAFAGIHGETHAFTAAFEELSRSSAELSGGMEHIARAVRDIKQVAQEVAGGSQEMAVESQQIDESLHAMKAYSHEILEDMRKIDDQSADLTGSQSGISQYAVDTGKCLDGLYKELEKDGVMEHDGRAFNYHLIVLMHRNWLAQLRAFLDDRKKDLTVAGADYANCDLGRWIYGEGTAHQGNADYRNLEKLHQQFHADAGEIYRMKIKGDIDRAEALYTTLIGEYKQVVSLLSGMDAALNKKPR
jgi:methyl-accepting chemotaxis protein